MATLTGSPVAAPHQTSDVGTTPFPINLGARMHDSDGNEYQYVDFTATVYRGVTVSISTDGNFTAAPLAEQHQGAVGVTMGTATSDNSGWVQIYGRHSGAQLASGSSDVTSAMVAIVASSVSSPNAGFNAVARTTIDYYTIEGMYVVAVASTATTSGTSHTGAEVPVFLVYPHCKSVVSGVNDPTS
jgi:hypothetical protein|tara:strand:+ start:199 stop:756 length:558 start_codon:yes stop_codon:yes gene_type:complete